MALDILDGQEIEELVARGLQTAKMIVEAEIATLNLHYDSIKQHWPNPEDLCAWWVRQHRSLPSLAQAVLAIMTNKISFGGLQCDFGGTSRVLARKQSWLAASLV